MVFYFFNPSNAILLFLVCQKAAMAVNACKVRFSDLPFSLERCSKNWNCDPHARWDAYFCLIPMLGGNAFCVLFNTSAVILVENIHF